VLWIRNRIRIKWKIRIRIRIRIRITSDKLNPDPHQSDTLDPDPLQFADDKPKCMEYEPIWALFQGLEPLFGR
jgi:hypothetical protein